MNTTTRPVAISVAATHTAPTRPAMTFLWIAQPGHRAHDEALERARVEQSVEAVGRAAAAEGLGDAAQAEEPAREAEQVARREGQHLLHAHRAPEVDEPRAAAVGLVVAPCAAR